MFGENLRQVIVNKGLSESKAANLLDIKRPTLISILNEQNSPGIDKLYKILTVWPDLNANWLLTGRGSMFIAQTQTQPSPSTAQEPETAYKTGKVMDLIERLEHTKLALSKTESDLAKAEKLIIVYEKRINELEARLAVYEGNGGEKKSANL